VSYSFIFVIHIDCTVEVEMERERERDKGTRRPDCHVLYSSSGTIRVGRKKGKLEKSREFRTAP
jgi:hypothetical protein